MSTLSKESINRAIKILNDTYPDANCELGFESVFQLLVAVVLSAQTTDASVNKVTPKLFGKYPDAHSISQMKEEELQGIIRSIGLYRTKAKNIIALSKIISKEYNGQVPEDYDKLIALPGVGRKSANVVLASGFGQQRIAVDTHVFRVANRIGLVNEKNVLQTELSLMKVLPEEQWTKMHHALIWHGRRICESRKPKCEICPLAPICKKSK